LANKSKSNVGDGKFIDRLFSLSFGDLAVAEENLKVGVRVSATMMLDLFTTF